jgi:hypothetical protein
MSFITDFYQKRSEENVRIAENAEVLKELDRLREELEEAKAGLNYWRDKYLNTQESSKPKRRGFYSDYSD